MCHKKSSVNEGLTKSHICYQVKKSKEYISKVLHGALQVPHTKSETPKKNKETEREESHCHKRTNIFRFR